MLWSEFWLEKSLGFLLPTLGKSEKIDSLDHFSEAKSNLSKVNLQAKAPAK